MPNTTEHLVEQMATQTVTASPAFKAGIVIVLGGTSYTLQDIAHVVSIVAGVLGIIYSLHLLVDFWWKKYRRCKLEGAAHG